MRAMTPDGANRPFGPFAPIPLANDIFPQPGDGVSQAQTVPSVVRKPVFPQVRVNKRHDYTVTVPLPRAWCVRSRRGRRTRHRHTKAPQELGRPWTSPGAIFRRGDRITNPRPAVVRSGPQGANDRRSTWYCQAKHNEARQEGRRESHIFIVPAKQGSWTAGTLGREGRCSSWTRARQPVGGFEPRSRVHVTLTDSKAGK